MRIHLPFHPPYDWRRAQLLVSAHAVPGAEEVDLQHGTVRRLVQGAAVTVRARGDGLQLETDAAADPEQLVAVVRDWLDLDHDPAALADTFAADPRLGPLLAALPGLRRIGYPHAYEAVVLTVIGQQVSLAAGRTFAGRLVRAYGTPGPGGLIAFPRPRVLAALDPLELQQATGLTGARCRTLRAVSTAFADHPGLAVAGPQTPADRDRAAAALLALPGIGPWTADYLRLRLLADPDAFPAGDLVLRRALGGVSAAEATRLAEPWRPWRGYAVIHLWTAAVYA